MKNRCYLHYIFITLKGMAMGAADVVPGVSGGTIAFISGIYEELITSINHINISLFKTFKNGEFKNAWNRINGNFLLALFTGIFTSLFSLATAVNWLLKNEPILLWSFFFGLVTASIYFVGKAIEKWNTPTITMLLFGTAVAYFITTLPPNENIDTLPYLFFSGAIAVCAMILPGISGAFILVLLGSYETILEAVHEKNVKILATISLGAIFGLLSFARFLKWMFKNYKNATLAVLTGFILGSLPKIWPWKKILKTKIFGEKIMPIEERNISPFSFEGNNQLLFAIILGIIGFSLIFMLEKMASKEQANNL